MDLRRLARARRAPLFLLAELPNQSCQYTTKPNVSTIQPVWTSNRRAATSCGPKHAHRGSRFCALHSFGLKQTLPQATMYDLAMTIYFGMYGAVWKPKQ